MPKSLNNIELSMIHDADLEEKMFVAWAGTGSLAAAKRTLTNQGYVTTGGKPYEGTQIYQRAYHWLAFHPQSARKYMADLADQHYTDDEWVRWWVSKSLLGLKSEVEAAAWIREYGIVFDITKNFEFPPDTDTLR